MASELSERSAIIDRLRPKILAYELSVESVKEILTRLALTELPVLREIERTGMEEVARRMAGMEKP